VNNVHQKVFVCIKGIGAANPAVKNPYPNKQDEEEILL